LFEDVIITGDRDKPVPPKRRHSATQVVPAEGHHIAAQRPRRTVYQFIDDNFCAVVTVMVCIFCGLILWMVLSV